jgi:hypothetical protein
MTRARSESGAVALFALMLGAGCGGTSDPEGAGATGVSGGAAGSAGDAGSAGVSGSSGVGGGGGDGGSGGAAGTGGAAGSAGTGTCCPTGNCICRGTPPPGLTADPGPYDSDSYSISGVGCVYYPTDAEPPFSAVAIADGLSGAGGCGSIQTGRWGPLYASHGIVAMIVVTGGGDQPAARGDALLEGIAAFKSENTKSGSPLFGKLAGRYSTSGFSMGGGGTTRATVEDSTLLSSVAIMAWSPVGAGVTVPTIFICGSSDGLAGCGSHGTRAYTSIPDSTPKIRVTVSSGHNGQPSAGSSMSGAWGLAFQKLYLDGDERWRSVLLSGDNDATNIQ